MGSWGDARGCEAVFGSHFGSEIWPAGAEAQSTEPGSTVSEIFAVAAAEISGLAMLRDRFILTFGRNGLFHPHQLPHLP